MLTPLRPNAVQYPKDIPNTDIADHVYLDINFYNNTYLSPSDPTQYIRAQVSQDRTGPLLYDTSYYNMAIDRFSIGADVIARVIQDPLATTGTTTFDVGLSYNGVYYDEPILLPLISTPDGFAQRAVYNVQAFLDILNAGYAAAQLLVTSAGGPTGMGTTVITFDNISQLFTLNVPTYYGTGTVGTTGNGIGVHMSALLYKRFQSFNVIQNLPLLYNKHDITFVREYTGNNYVTDLVFSGGITGTYLGLAQEVAWPSSLLQYNRLVITTNSLPVFTEYVANINYAQFGGGQANQTLAVVTDFLIGSDIPLSNPASPLTYNPTFLRLISLKGGVPLTRFDLQIYLELENGSFVPLILAPDSAISLKIVFLKKGLTS